MLVRVSVDIADIVIFQFFATISNAIQRKKFGLMLTKRPKKKPDRKNFLFNEYIQINVISKSKAV